LHEVGDQIGNAIRAPLRKAVFDDDVFILFNRTTGKLSIEIFNNKRQLAWDSKGTAS